MPHMSKCFQAIEKLSTDEAGGGRPSATGMESCVGKEYVKWSKPMKLEGKVEEYMNLIIDKMRSELKVNLYDSIKAYNNPKPRHEWQFEWTSQMILVVSQIYWCQETEAAFAKMQKGDAKGMYDYNQQQVSGCGGVLRGVVVRACKPCLRHPSSGSFPIEVTWRVLSTEGQLS